VEVLFTAQEMRLRVDQSKVDGCFEFDRPDKGRPGRIMIHVYETPATYEAWRFWVAGLFTSLCHEIYHAWEWSRGVKLAMRRCGPEEARAQEATLLAWRALMSSESLMRRYWEVVLRFMDGSTVGSLDVTV
jgi:hypothetical protein